VIALSSIGDRSGGGRIFSLLALAGLCLSGCAQAPQPVARHAHYKEHFAEGAYWGKASERLYEDGQTIPRGGGQYLVGRPYRVGGRMYYPREDDHYVAEGMASWYGDAFHGRKTANGEIYDKRALTAAHPTMPLPSYARVTNLSNGYSVIVRVNDRGPYAAGRVMDMSSRVADVLDFKRMGTAHVRVEYVGRAPLEGSDDDQLLATLRTDGGPAELGGATMTAQSAPLGGLFGGVAEAAPPPPPPPEPPPEEPVARRIERPAPVAAPEPPPRPESEEVADAEETVAPRHSSSAAPLPPVRPYDLGAKQASVFPKPPVRPGSGDRALYFADPPRPHDDPLARLIRHRAAVRDDE
jgi:rare lipoprotein A